MKKNSVVILIVVIVFFALGAFLANKSGNKNLPLIGSNSAKTTQEEKSPPTPTATPKTFHFDQSTNLKGELENVNPQVLDEDFKDLDSLVKDF